MIFLRSFSRVSASGEAWPMNLPLLRNFDALEFSAPVTFLTGDNGCGKTTLMELLACLSRAVRIDGGLPDEKQHAVRAAARNFRTQTVRRPDRCFYFHAEGFVRYTDDFARMRTDAQRDLEDIYSEKKYGSDYARQLASQPFQNTLHSMNALYEHDVTARSHGERFLDFFGGRLTSGGLFLLDEPEAALSYENQYVLLHMIAQAAARDCQFVIATHSPILPALPEAQILSVRDAGIAPIAYGELSNVRFLRDFLAAPERYCRALTD